ncbi:MAG: GNAT family N-acetyltransferase [Austwickia sp.]|nr:GNAT family N-acetyltransferase [Austwickia sp.]MCO5307952.1 GNAT family N-acetyltransferase [Austwickia sp.]
MSDQLTIRPARPDEARVSALLSQEAFGAPQVLPEPPPDPTAAHKPTWFAELGGRVVGKACDRPYESWYGGRRVPTSGIASVAVQPEVRGRGVAKALLRHTLAQAHARGAVISTLYPTAPAIYRGLGFGVVGAYTWFRVPTAALAAVRPPAHDVLLERVDEHAWPELLACYTAWARDHDGPLSRDDDGYPIPSVDIASHRITLARDASGSAVGYAAWTRTGGLGEQGLLEVPDLVATTADAARALLRSLGSQASAAPQTHLLGAGEDLLPWFLPTKDVTPIDRRPYQLAVLDVAGALTARGWAPNVRVVATVAVEGLVVPGQDGRYRLEIADGLAHVERLGDVAEGTAGAAEGTPRLTAAGLGMLYAGCPPRLLRLAGQLSSEPAPDALDALDAIATATAGRGFAVRDYF